MPEFLELMPPGEALSLYLENLSLKPEAERVNTVNSLFRVTFEPVLAPFPLPSFPRSTVDGYAVKAADTLGASDSLPAYLDLAGEILMGLSPGFSISKTECALIHTGGMLPEGADAVVMLEYSQSVREEQIEIHRPVAVGENVIQIGEDVAQGEVVIPSGALLREVELGGLMALGITQLNVSRKPRVGIISSGDEVQVPTEELNPGQVYDVNSYSLSALVENTGGDSLRYGIAPDKARELYALTEKALSECDLVVITAGSSASARDLTAQVIEELGPPGVLVHGVNVRPGKPTILAICQGKAVIGLPGNPVSAFVIASLFVRPVIEKLLGLRNGWRRQVVKAQLDLNLASQAGREDWVAVRLLRRQDRIIAEPVFGKSNLIFTLVRADGLIHIPASATGINAGEEVEVVLL